MSETLAAWQALEHGELYVIVPIWTFLIVTYVVTAGRAWWDGEDEE